MWGDLVQKSSKSTFLSFEINKIEMKIYEKQEIHKDFQNRNLNPGLNFFSFDSKYDSR